MHLLHFHLKRDVFATFSFKRYICYIFFAVVGEQPCLLRNQHHEGRGAQPRPHHWQGLYISPSNLSQLLINKKQKWRKTQREKIESCVFGQVREILKVSLGIARDVPILRVKRAHTGAGSYFFFFVVSLCDVICSFSHEHMPCECWYVCKCFLFLFDNYFYLSLSIC